MSLRATWIAAVGVLVAAGCERPGPSTTTSLADQTYTVRGRIERLPGPDGPLAVHHEAIPDFVGRDGKVVGMGSMTMEFEHVATGVPLDGLAVGDGVAMTFEIRWRSEPRMLVTKIEKLPAGTELDFGPK